VNRAFILRYRFCKALKYTIQRNTIVAFVVASPEKYWYMFPPGEQSTTSELRASPGRCPAMTVAYVATE